MNPKRLLLKIKKIHPDAHVPEFAHKGDAGGDLIATSLKYDGDEYIEFGTGIAVEIPDGYVGLLFPRSSISNKSHNLANSVGVVDSSYRGEIKARFRRLKNGQDEYKIGDKIAQLMIIPYNSYSCLVVNELGKSDREEGSFGSTG